MSQTRKHPPGLDPRAPLVLDTRELGRRPGSMRKVSLTVPAPADLAVELVGVPTGSDLDLDLRLEAVMEGVLVTGTVRAPIAGECARCLDPASSVLEAEIQELYAYPDDGAAPPPGEPGDEETYRLEGDLLDLEPAVRDAVVTGLPLAPLCRDDCLGLCPDCGARLAVVEPDHGHDGVDPRWATLERLQSSSTDPGGNSRRLTEET